MTSSPCVDVFIFSPYVAVSYFLACGFCRCACLACVCACMRVCALLVCVFVSGVSSCVLCVYYYFCCFYCCCYCRFQQTIHRKHFLPERVFESFTGSICCLNVCLSCCCIVGAAPRSKTSFESSLLTSPPRTSFTWTSCWRRGSVGISTDQWSPRSFVEHPA